MNAIPHIAKFARSNMAPGSLRNERARGLGPPFVRIGKTVFYPIKELQKYLAANKVVPSKRATLTDGRGRNRA